MKELDQMITKKMVLLGSSDNGQRLYYVIGFDKRPNGIVESYGEFSNVDLMAYLTRPNSIKPIKKSKLQKKFWEFDYENEDWQKTFLVPASKPDTELVNDSDEYISPVPSGKKEESNMEDFFFGSMENQVREDPKKPNKKEEEISDIQTKGRMRLPSFGKPARAAQSVNAMFDGDLDGRVGDGTPEERPAPPVRIIKDIMNHIMVRNPGDTKKALTDRKGNWNPERVQLHNAISTMFRRRGTKSEDPTVFLLGGGPASRKSSALNAGLPRMPKDGEAVNADADQIKELIPEYKSWKKTDKHAASHVHQESKHIHSVVTDDLLEDQSDVIYDTTGDGNYGDFKKRVGGLRKNGHKIVAHYMTNDIELAKELNYKRYKETGRKVPTHQLEYIHGQVSRVVPQALKDDLFDEFYLYDTNNLTKPPRLIASKKRGEPLKVQDKYAFKRFLKKGVPPKPPKSSKLPESSGKFKLPGFSGKPKAPTLPIGDFGGKKPKR
jgi:hypothetical protein